MSTASNRRLQVFVALVALAALIVPLFATGQPVRAAEKVLRWSLTGEPATIDPQQSYYTDMVAYDQALWRGLLRYDEKGNPEPSIAKEVPTEANGGITEGGKVYTFHLQDWKWSDGKGVVTAQDFVYSWQRLVDPAQASAYGAVLNGIVLNASAIQAGKAEVSTLGVKAVDDKTFQVTLEKPLGYFNQIAALWFGYAVRKDNVERPGLASAAAWTDPANGEVVGSGPFKITKWEHNSQLVFEKNPNFSGTPAKVDKIVFTLQDDPAVMYAGYKAGEQDIAGVPLAELDAVRADPKLSKELNVYSTLCTWYFRMDNTKPPFDNVKVRQAFAHAIDRDTYIQVINKGMGNKTYSLIPPGMPGYEPDAGKDLEFDPVLAKKLLADAGYPDGKDFPKFPFNYVAGASNQRRGEWFQAQLKQVLNVDVELQPMEGAAYQQATGDAKLKIPGTGRSGWCADWPHPSDWFGVLFKSGGEQGNALNSVGYNNPEFDKLSDQADSELDPTKALQLYSQLQKLLLQDSPVVFIYNDQTWQMISPNVKGVKTTSLDGGMPGSQFWEDIDIAS
jgi:oligopeptide transport system substrate-binding protein